MSPRRRREDEYELCQKSSGEGRPHPYIKQNFPKYPADAHELDPSHILYHYMGEGHTDPSKVRGTLYIKFDPNSIQLNWYKENSFFQSIVMIMKAPISLSL